MGFDFEELEKNTGKTLTDTQKQQLQAFVDLIQDANEAAKEGKTLDIKAAAEEIINKAKEEQ